MRKCNSLTSPIPQRYSIILALSLLSYVSPKNLGILEHDVDKKNTIIEHD